jgi:AraC-like DNA-binding protein
MARDEVAFVARTPDAVETHWRPLMGEPGSRTVGAFTVVPALIQQLGADPSPIFAEAGVTYETLADRSARIAWGSLTHLLRTAALRTGCRHFGLLVGREWRLSDLGLLGELVRHSPTIGAALNELIANQHLNSEGTLAYLRRQGDDIDLGYASYVAFPSGADIVYEAVLAAAANFMRELAGDRWNPSRVQFQHSPPSDLAPYREHFRAPLNFDAKSCALRFSADWLTRRIRGVTPERLRRAREQAKAVDKAVLLDKIFRALRILLLHGSASGADVAHALAMHRRTFNRRLNSEGTTFQQVLDRVRFAVAKELLESSQLTLPKISEALCYADEASMIHAFRRWTGTTPGAWRQSARTDRGCENAPQRDSIRAANDATDMTE